MKTRRERAAHLLKHQALAVLLWVGIVLCMLFTGGWAWWGFFTLAIVEACVFGWVNQSYRILTDPDRIRESWERWLETEVPLIEAEFETHEVIKKLEQLATDDHRPTWDQALADLRREKQIAKDQADFEARIKKNLERRESAAAQAKEKEKIITLERDKTLAEIERDWKIDKPWHVNKLELTFQRHPGGENIPCPHPHREYIDPPKAARNDTCLVAHGHWERCTWCDGILVDNEIWRWPIGSSKNPRMMTRLPIALEHKDHDTQNGMTCWWFRNHWVTLDRHLYGSDIYEWSGQEWHLIDRAPTIISELAVAERGIVNALRVPPVQMGSNPFNRRR